jgi:hypothetical protein
MLQKINFEEYTNVKIVRASSLFTPRYFKPNSALLLRLRTLFPYVFQSEIPTYKNVQFFTLYSILHLIFSLLKVHQAKQNSVIDLRPHLSNVFEINFCTKAELKNLIKKHLLPFEFFEVELFDPTGYCQIPHPSSLFQVWSISFMVTFPTNRRALTEILFSKDLVDIPYYLKHRIITNEKRQHPNFNLQFTTPLNFFNLLIRLILSYPHLFLDQSNILIITPLLTFELSETYKISVDSAYTHISRFPELFLNSLTKINVS